MKTRIWTLNFRKFFANFVIFLMLFAVSCVAIYGITALPSSKVIAGVYYSGKEESNKVSLMINVYWGTEYLDDMLDTLKKYDVKTTFFVGGTWAVRESDMLKKIVEQGHEIGNHGYHHKDQDKLSAEQNYQEISNTHELVKGLTGVEMNLFAPPSGAFGRETVEVAEGLGYKTIMWTEGRDTIDWRDKDKNLIYQRAIKNCKGGDFVLMHPTAATRDALEDIIVTLKEKGFQLCTVSENLI